MKKEDIKTVEFTVCINEDVYTFYEDMSFKMKVKPEELMIFILLDTMKKYKKKNKKKYKI